VSMNSVFRISTFGDFTIERLCPSGEEGQASHYEVISHKEWSNRGPAMAMLKILLCRTRRRASKDALIDAIWSEDEQQQMKNPEGALKSATNVLRDILRCPDGQTALMTVSTSDGLVFKLPDQEHLWVDADAFVASVSQAAKAEPSGLDTLPLWEDAFALLRGEFLEDDLYPDWVQAKRQELEGDRSLCVYRLARLYAARNRNEQAEALLHSFVAAHPTDENALCLLMDLLARDGRWSEVWRLCQKTERALREDGLSPAPSTRVRVERIPQARHVAAPFDTPAIMQTPLYGSFAQQTYHETPLLYQSSNIPLFNNLHLPREQHQSAWLTQGASYLGQLLTEGWSIDEILNSLQIVLQGVQGMPIIMRGKLLALGADAMISDISVLTGKHVSQEEQVQLHHALGESIATGWKLFHMAGNAQVLAVGQALLHVVQQNHSYLSSRIRAMYYSSVYNLIGVALCFQEQYQLALDVHMNAHVASLATGEVWYVVQSLICQANAYQALGQCNKAIQTIEEAFRVLGDQFEVKYVRAKAHLLGCYADNSIKLGDYINAQRQLEASEVLLDQIGPSEEFDATSWLHLAGNFALATRNYSKAIHFFEKALSMPQTSNLRHASGSVALAAAYLYADENASLAVVEQNVSIIETVNAPLVNKQLADYIQQGLLITSPENERVKTFVSDIQYRIPSLNRYIATLH